MNTQGHTCQPLAAGGKWVNIKESFCLSATVFRLDWLVWNCGRSQRGKTEEYIFIIKIDIFFISLYAVQSSQGVAVHEIVLVNF